MPVTPSKSPWSPGIGGWNRLASGDTVAISSEGNVLTFNGKAPQTAEIAQFEAPVAKRKLN